MLKSFEDWFFEYITFASKISRLGSSVILRGSLEETSSLLMMSLPLLKKTILVILRDFISLFKYDIFKLGTVVFIAFGIIEKVFR